VPVSFDDAERKHEILYSPPASKLTIRLKSNIGFTLRRVLAVFMRLAITEPNEILTLDSEAL